MAKKKPGRIKSMLEREKELDEMEKETGEASFEIVRDGVTYTVNSAGDLVPVSGKDAQKAVRKPRKRPGAK